MISEAAHAECVRLLDLLTNKRVQESWSWVFMTPVKDIPGYEDVVKKPMDLGTVKKNLGSKPSRCRFKSHEKFARDVRLVFHNAMLYNKADQNVKGSVFDAAQHLLRVFETAYAKAIETVFRSDDEVASKEKARAREAAGDPANSGVSASHSGDTKGGSAGDHTASTTSEHHRHHSEHRHRHRHHEDGDDGEEKHRSRKDKKEKKSKKSKKKSKDRDRDGDKEKKHRHHHRHSSSDSKKKSSSHHDSSEKSASTAVEPAALDAPPVSVPVSHAAPAAPAPDTQVVHSTKSSNSSGKTPSAVSNVQKMSDEQVTACLGVLMKLIKYKEGNVSPAAPFLQPVDLNHFPDYRIKVPNRMHLYGVQRKLRNGGYANLDDFAHDVRLIFANCLVYNSDVVISKVMRSHAVTLMKLFESQFAKIGGSWPGIPERWKCHQILQELLGHRSNGQETAQWFKYPFETYYDSPEQVPYGYRQKIKAPMDIGTVSSRLHLGIYKRFSEFADDLRLVFDNCITYWKTEPYGQAYCESAEVLIKLLETQSALVLRSSSSGPSDDKSKVDPSSGARVSKSQTPSSSALSKTSGSGGERDKGKKRSTKTRETGSGSGFAHKDVCMTILKQLRSHKMKGYRGIEILTAGPFLHAVDTTKYPDYLTIVKEPMDFAKIERKLKSDRYTSVSEFSADVHLIFSNCHKYNSDPVEGADIRAMASNLREYFVGLYQEKLGHIDGTLERHPAVAKPAPSGNSQETKLPAAPVRSAEPSGTHQKSHEHIDILAQKAAPATAPVERSRPEKPVQASVSGESQPAIADVPSVHRDSNSVKATATVDGAPAQAVARTDPSASHSLDAEALRRKKEKKEKRKKDKKDKKDRKEKKKKKHDKKHEKRHEKRHDKGGQDVTASQEGDAVLLKRAEQLDAPAKVSKSSTPSSIGSKMSRMDAGAASSASTSKKSKKSKKTDLKSWEASCERVLNRLGKFEQVAKLHFDRPLVEVFPQLLGEYTRLIPEPMDFRTLREQLHRHELVVEEFVRKGRLIFKNAIAFNSAEDPASVHVRDMSAHLLWYFDSLCVELHLATESGNGSSRTQLRQERATRVVNIPMEIKAKECQKLLRVLNSQKYDKDCWPFRKPVSVLFPTLPPEYYQIVKTPMDLTTISEKLSSFEYKLHGDFIRDVRLTFENALLYNRPDKDREGWTVYSAAVHMLSVAEDLWGDVTLEVMEKTRRREILRKERERLSEKKEKAQGHTKSAQDALRKSTDDSSSKKSLVAAKSADRSVKVAKPASDAARPPLPPSASSANKSNVTVVSGETIVPTSASADSSVTRVKLHLVNRTNLERMNKSERKAEEKRRKRARREEEIARSEKRRRTAVAATDDALREAETRSRRRMRKLEVVEARHAREEQERRAHEEAEARALAEKRKFDEAAWTGALVPATQVSSGFWSKKRVKLQVPAAFQTMINA